MSDSRKEIRFKNLPRLLGDMERKKWVIECFPFIYKNKAYFVILKIYGPKHRKPSKHAKASVEFIQRNDCRVTITGYVDFYNVHFNSVVEFCKFFDVKIKNADRDLFDDFSVIFSQCIPTEKSFNKTPEENQLIGSRAEGNNPNAVYCFDVRRNGTKEDGSPNVRSVENSNKAESLRYDLYKTYCDDHNLSFFFSDNPADERSDSEIHALIAMRAK